MKHFISGILLIFLAVIHTQAQDHKNLIKFNVFGVIGGQFQLNYERVLTEKMSVQGSLGYITSTSSQTFGTNKYSGKLSGIIIIPEYRIYLSAPAPSSFYVAPFFRFRQTSNMITDESADLNSGGINVSRTDHVVSYGGGFTVGNQWLLGKNKNIVLDFFVGPQYKSRSSHSVYKYPNANDDEFSNKFISYKIEDRQGFGVRLGFNFGIAF